MPEMFLVLTPQVLPASVTLTVFGKALTPLYPLTAAAVTSMELILQSLSLALFSFLSFTLMLLTLIWAFCLCFSLPLSRLYCGTPHDFPVSINIIMMRIKASNSSFLMNQGTSCVYGYQKNITDDNTDIIFRWELGRTLETGSQAARSQTWSHLRPWKHATYHPGC